MFCRLEAFHFPIAMNCNSSLSRRQVKGFRKPFYLRLIQKARAIATSQWHRLSMCATTAPYVSVVAPPQTVRRLDCHHLCHVCRRGTTWVICGTTPDIPMLRLPPCVPFVPPWHRVCQLWHARLNICSGSIQNHRYPPSLSDQIDFRAVKFTPTIQHLHSQRYSMSEITEQILRHRLVARSRIRAKHVHGTGEA